MNRLKPLGVEFSSLLRLQSNKIRKEFLACENGNVLREEEEKIVFQPLNVDFLKGGFCVSELTMCEQQIYLVECEKFGA